MSDDALPITDPPQTATYLDDDLVYVDPDLKIVVGRVEFKENGMAKALAMPSKFAEPEAPEATPPPAPTPKGKDTRPPRKPRQRFYPWGTYRTMKKIYKIEGKIPEPERTLTLDDVMAKALEEPYWD